MRAAESSRATGLGDPQNDELDSYDGVSYAYDANGNRVMKADVSGNTTYTYDFENRLVRVDLPGGGWVTHDYDALGRRVRKNVNGSISLYWYQEEDVFLETDAAGNELARYTHGPGIDAPLKVNRGSATHYYHEDALGSIVMMTDDQKSPRKSYVYDAFGNVTLETGTVENAYTYTSRERDAESALYYYRARHYDPKAGRFLQRDPVAPRPEEMNSYVYVSNDPVNAVDPSGNYLIEGNACAGSRGRIESEIDNSCSHLNTIIDGGLRSCIWNKCMFGKVKCSGTGCNDNTLLGYNCGLDDEDIWLCPGNVGGASYGDIAVHEWAEQCGWKHGDGKGVPGDSGQIAN